MRRQPKSHELEMNHRRVPLRTLAAAALVLAGCGGAGTATPPADTATTTGVATTVTDPSTTTSPPSTTTTPVAVGPWHVEGRRYYFPVQPPEVASYREEHHDYPATDIFAPAGTTVVAVTDGVVHEISRVDEWDPEVDDGATRAGLFVTIVGDDGVRYHASHLATVEPGIEPGVRVGAGQVIGTVGDTGNANLPHVHFGISRPGGPGDWETRRGEVWPYEYLQAWTRGEAATPVLPGE
jgi:murein DD-endopeptidase MepM/ murein hydrolase activator NlpD